MGVFRGVRRGGKGEKREEQKRRKENKEEQKRTRAFLQVLMYMATVCGHCDRF